MPFPIHAFRYRKNVLKGRDVKRDFRMLIKKYKNRFRFSFFPRLKVK